MKKEQIIILVPFILSIFLSSCAANKYWQVLSVSQEGGQAFTKVTEKEELLDNGSIFAVSNDGTKIAFTSWKTGNGDIYVKNITVTGGKALLQRTFRNETEFAPAFSPDGKNIAFTAFRDGQYRIYMIGAESGAAIRQITTSSPRHAENPVFSPDGRLLAFNSVDYNYNPYNKQLSRAGNEYIWTYSIENGVLTQYAEGLMPRFTPDGKKIIFKRAAKAVKPYYGLWSINLESGAETNILSGEDFGIGSFSISPDGKKIAIATAKDTKNSKHDVENNNIWVVNMNGTQMTQLTFHPGEDFNPVWAPDMKSIYFLSNRGEEKQGTVNVWQLSYKN